MTTAFLGPRGSFSEEAALMRATEADTLPRVSFPAAVAAVESGLATEAVLPIENSIEGSVTPNLDLLIHETPLRITGELMLPVRHFLVTREGVALEDITVVSSHPQALGQCRRFLDRYLPNAAQEATLSTSGAVQEAAESTEGTRAGIGPLRAAELYGGAILAHDIQDQLGKLVVADFHEMYAVIVADLAEITGIIGAAHHHLAVGIGERGAHVDIFDRCGLRLALLYFRDRGDRCIVRRRLHRRQRNPIDRCAVLLQRVD